MPDKKLTRAIESAKRDALGVEEKCQLVGALLKAGRLETALEIPSLHSVVLSVVDEPHERPLILAARRVLQDAQYIQRRGILGILIELARRGASRGGAPRDLLRQIHLSVSGTVRFISGAHEALHRAAIEMLSDSPPDIAALLRSERESDQRRGMLCASICADAVYVSSILEMTSDPAARHAACLAMISMRDDASIAVRELRAAVLKDESEACPARVLQAIEYVRRARAEEALPLLAKIATRGSFSIRESARRALMFWPDRNETADRLGRELARSNDPAERATGLAMSVRHAPLDEAVCLLREAVGDFRPVVRLAALRAAARLPLHEDVLVDLVGASQTGKDEEVRVAGVGLLGTAGDSERLRHVLDLAATAELDGVRAAAIGIVASNDRISADWRRKRLAVAAVDPVGVVSTKGIVGLLSLDREARSIGLRLARRLEPALQADVLRGLPNSRTEVRPRDLAVFLRSPHTDVVSAALGKMSRMTGQSATLGMALTVLHRARDQGAVELFDYCRKAGKLESFERFDWLLKRSKSQSLRAMLAETAMQKWKDRIGPEWLMERMRDPAEGVRLCVARQLPQFDLQGSDPLIISSLRDPSHLVAKTVLVDTVVASHLRLPTDVLADLVMRPDCDGDIAIIAMSRLADRLPDPRAYSTIMALLLSRDEVVSGIARRILKRMERESRTGVSVPDWRAMEHRIRDLYRWGEGFGRRVLGRAVRIQTLRDGLGLTVDDESQAVKIWVNPVAMTMNEPHGEDIVRGLIAHEIGHHFHDIRQPGQRRCRRAADREGIRHIFDLLIDERLERFMRRIDPGDSPPLGRCFDRLAAYAFASGDHAIPLKRLAAGIGSEEHTIRSELEIGLRRGRIFLGAGMEQCVSLPMIDVLRIDGLLAEFGQFHACFRGGHDPHRFASPPVRAALALVPADLRSMSHDGVLALARQIDGVLRRQNPGQDRDARPLIVQLAGQSEDGIPIPVHVACTRRGRRTPARRTRAMPSPDYIEGVEGRVQGLTIRDLRSRSSDAQAVNSIRASIRPHVSALAHHFGQIGVVDTDRPRSRSGVRVDTATARRAAFLPVTDALIGRRTERNADLALALVIDRSGSMRGGRIELAKTIAVLLAESASSVPGVEGHVAAFTDRSYDILADLGRARRFGAIGGLAGEGGNNDAAAVACAVEMLRASKRSRKVLCMLSDGMPAECTVEQLREQVRIAETRHGIRCVQIAVAPIFHIGFTEFIDVSACQLGDGVKRIAGVLASLAAGKPVRSDVPVSMAEYRSKEIKRRRRIHETAQEGVKM